MIRKTGLLTRQEEGSFSGGEKYQRLWFLVQILEKLNNLEIQAVQAQRRQRQEGQAKK
jgi:hypothetical protein